MPRQGMQGTVLCEAPRLGMGLTDYVAGLAFSLKFLLRAASRSTTGSRCSRAFQRWSTNGLMVARRGSSRRGSRRGVPEIAAHKA